MQLLSTKQSRLSGVLGVNEEIHFGLSHMVMGLHHIHMMQCRERLFSDGV